MSTLTDLRDTAEAHQAGRQLGFATDASSSDTHVAIAISTPAAAFVMTIEKAEYDGLNLAELLGFPTMPVAEWRRRTKATATASSGARADCSERSAQRW